MIIQDNSDTKITNTCVLLGEEEAWVWKGRIDSVELGNIQANLFSITLNHSITAVLEFLWANPVAFLISGITFANDTYLTFRGVDHPVFDIGVEVGLVCTVEWGCGEAVHAILFIKTSSFAFVFISLYAE